MLTIPCAISYGSGAEVQHSLDDLTTSIKSPDGLPSVLNGKPAPGIADAWKALQKNEFNSFYGTDNNYGATKGIFHKKKFSAKVTKAPFVTSMMVKEKHCLGMSLNGLQHSNNFNDTLTYALKYAKVNAPEKYNNTVKTYVMSRMKVEHRAAAAGGDVDFNNSSPQK